jgi:hypothetical protein
MAALSAYSLLGAKTYSLRMHKLSKVKAKTPVRMAGMDL